MSVVETPVNQALKWVVLWRKSAADKYKVYVHPNAKVASRYNSIEGAGGTIRMLRRQGKEACAVREDRAYTVYGILL